MNLKRKAALNRIAAQVGAIGRELEALRDDELGDFEALPEWELEENDWRMEIIALLGEALDSLRNAKTAIIQALEGDGEVKP